MSRTSRLEAAVAADVFAVPESGTVAVLGAADLADIDGLPRERVTCVSRFRPTADAFLAAGVPVQEDLPEAPGLVIIHLPRAKAQAMDWIAQASATEAIVVINGDKTAGIESIRKELSQRVSLPPAFSKAHGKVQVLPAGLDLSDWRAHSSHVDGFETRPGVFSSDGPDPGSVLLAGEVAGNLNGAGADLGGGWGYLSVKALDGNMDIEELHIVEADGVALDCAKANVADRRARFHWADATRWVPDRKLDFVLMNPPFHTGRSGEPGLGQAFIKAAASMLKPGGSLWLVANRHLPYEKALTSLFASVRDLGDDTKFKLFVASGPVRQRN